MISPFDASQAVLLQNAVYSDSSDGYLITDIAAIRRDFEGKIQQLSTREMKLDTLGIFPLAKDAMHLLDKELTHGGATLSIHPLLKNSQIPIYADAKSSCAYIPAEGANICRYFHDLWRIDSGNLHDTEAVLAGFVILASYAGI